MHDRKCLAGSQRVDRHIAGAARVESYHSIFRRAEVAHAGDVEAGRRCARNKRHIHRTGRNQAGGPEHIAAFAPGTGSRCSQHIVEQARIQRGRRARRPAAIRARSRLGIAIAAMIRMIPTTIRSSINENPLLCRIFAASPLAPGRIIVVSTLLATPPDCPIARARRKLKKRIKP